VMSLMVESASISVASVHLYRTVWRSGPANNVSPRKGCLQDLGSLVITH
jgi:hypothetical protein